VAAPFAALSRRATALAPQGHVIASTSWHGQCGQIREMEMLSMKSIPLLIISLTAGPIAGCHSEKKVHVAAKTVKDGDRRSMENPQDDERGGLREARLLLRMEPRLPLKRPAMDRQSSLSVAPLHTAISFAPNHSSPSSPSV
jgi:hypothetical protein